MTKGYLRLHCYVEKLRSTPAGHVNRAQCPGQLVGMSTAGAAPSAHPGSPAPSLLFPAREDTITFAF